MEDAESAAGPEAGIEYADLPVRHVTCNQLAAWNLTYFRRAAGLSGEELGARLGWSKAVVSAAERSWDGRRVRQFTVDDLVAIALALEIPVIALLLPPPDAGTAVRYVLDGYPAPADVVTTLVPHLTHVYAGGTPMLATFWDRVLAIGASRYMNPVGFDAERMYQEALGQLPKVREELERRIDDLRTFERDYRRKLGAFLEAQLADFRAIDRPESGTSPSIGSEANRGEQP